MGQLPVNPTWRKPAGVFLILLLIAVWSVVAVSAFELIGDAAWPLQALFFLIAGTVWVLPLKPLLRWMETGRFRAAPRKVSAARNSGMPGASDGT